MYHEAALFSRFRFVLAGLMALAVIVLFSAVITIIGSGTVLASPTPDAASAVPTDVVDTPNVVTAVAVNLLSGGQRLSLATGAELYAGCHHITMASAHAGRLTLQAGSSITRGMADGVMSVARLPGKAISSLTKARNVVAILRPADNKPVPVISSETSAAALATLNAAQQQAFAQLQAAQVVANRSLGGVVIAGDPDHGGYPAVWDNAAQDSRLDSWGC